MTQHFGDDPEAIPSAWHIRKGYIRAFTSGTHKGDIQLVGSHPTLLTNIRFATDIPAAECDVGRECLVIFLDPINQTDAIVLSVQGAVPKHFHPHAQAYLSGNVSIFSGSETILNWNREHLDNDNIHDNAVNNSRLTCRTPGTYRVNCQLPYAASAGGDRRRIQFYKGVGICPGFVQLPPTAAGFTGLQATVQIPLALNEYVRAAGYQNTGGNLDIIGGATGAMFEMELIS